MRGGPGIRATARLAAFGLVAALAGCSVATIDVDVYKGPLADHEDIQVQQMASLAIAAKPPLIRLRDDLELSYLRERKKDKETSGWYRRKVPTGRLKALEGLRQNSRYREGYVCNPLDAPFFASREAHFVNAVLYLYDNKNEANRNCADEGSANARHLSEALKAAYAQRASMAFLRPASAYLRSVQAATSLQDNSLGWRNMLTGTFGRILGDDDSDKEDRKTIDEIDKQFWQNVNRVQVAGSGTTNYVLAKDDVGNWYVKGYASDTTDITNSMFKLAKFNIGAQLGNNLLRPKGEGEAARQPSQMERVSERYTTSFREATTTIYGEVRTEISDINTADSILQRIGASIDALPKVGDTDKNDLKIAVNSVPSEFSGVRTTFGKPFPTDKAAEERGRRIVDALRAMRAFRARAVSNIPAEAKIPEDEAKSVVDGKKNLAEAEAKLKAAEKQQADINKDEPLPSTAERDRARDDVTAKREERDKARFSLADAERNLANAKRIERSAIQVVNSVVLDTLDRYVGKRVSAVTSYDSSITFIGDALRPEKKAEATP